MRSSWMLGLMMGALAQAGCGGDVTVTTGAGGAGGGGNGAGAGATTSETGTGTGTGSSTITGTSTDPGEFGACNGPGQCMLARKTCCPPCGQAEADDFNAVNVAKLEDYYEKTCPEPVPCPACATAENPHLFAYCDAGTCVVADTRTHGVGECLLASDCFVRVGTSCCEPCDPVDVSQVTAVSKKADPSLPELVCSPSTACDDCLPQIPPEAGAFCSKAGQCFVTVADGG